LHLRAGMKTSLELGRWVFLAPIGSINAPRAMRQSLMHQELAPSFAGCSSST
jgi:hypothetical protein